MSSTVPIHVAFWNAWLLRPRLWPEGPAVPGGDRFFAPEVRRRAPLVGAAIRDRFDVCALSEVFEPSEQRSVAAAAPGYAAVPGPGRGRFRFTGSGLMALVDERRFEVASVASITYRTDGDARDSDSFATKGAMLTRVRPRDGGPELDLVSTHLFAGGDLFPIPGAEDGNRHHRVRLGQIDELVDFVADNRDPGNALIVCGDFNVAASDRRLTDRGARYRDLAGRLEPLGLVDVWAAGGVGPGDTSSFTHPSDLPPDPDEPDRIHDDADADEVTSPGDRIDYLWIAPALDRSVVVDVEPPRRWGFPGRGVAGGPAGSLSDHLLLSARIHLRPN